MPEFYHQTKEPSITNPSMSDWSPRLQDRNKRDSNPTLIPVIPPIPITLSIARSRVDHKFNPATERYEVMRPGSPKETDPAKPLPQLPAEDEIVFGMDLFDDIGPASDSGPESSECRPGYKTDRSSKDYLR